VQRYQINYRHVIDSLLRKPGGFRNYRHRDDLFPRAVFRQAWEALARRLSPRKADLAYLRILKLAAQGLETDVSDALEFLLASGTDWDEQSVSALVKPIAATLPDLAVQDINLSLYDQLLGREAGVSEGCHVWA
jgi:hypothetical protein